MESQMTREELEKVVKHLEKELDLKRREREEVAEIYEKQRQIVFHFLSIASITIVIHITLVQWLIQNDNLSLKGIGTYIQPINFTVFMLTAVYTIVRGYDFFMNSNHVLARKLNEKLKKRSITDELAMMLENIRLLQREVDRLNGELRARDRNSDKQSDKGLDNEIDNESDNELLNNDMDFEENSIDMWEQDVLKK